MSPARAFFAPLLRERYLLFSMARREVGSQHAGSVLGMIWTVVQPLTMISIYWLVFEVGFKARPAQDIPFAVWLTAGLAAWNLFADALNASTRVVIHNATLIKKTLFPAQILLPVRILASLFTHAVMLLILGVFMAAYQLPLTWFALQGLYYLVALLVLTLGLAWMAAALTVFVKDTAPLVALLLQFLFWGTPIMWDLSIMPERLHPYFRLNPLYYIVQGYRDSFFYATPFWEHPEAALWFWAVALTLLLCGSLIFHRLSPHFADVL